LILKIKIKIIQGETMRLNLTVMLCWTAALGCGGGSPKEETDPAACAESDAWQWLDPAHGAGAQGLVAAYEDVDGARSQAGFGKASFSSLSSTYNTRISQEVLSLAHLPSWESTDAPQRLHGTITQALERGMSTVDSTPPLELWQQVNKSLARFLFLALHDRLQAGTATSVDEAYVLFGHGDGSAPSLLSAELQEYDSLVGTSQGPATVRAFQAARCAVLQGDAAALAAATRRVDDGIRLGLANAAARYFKLMSLGSGDRVQLVEGATWFSVVEPWMNSQGHAVEANRIRAWLDPLLPGGANATQVPDTAGAAAALNDMRTAFGLSL
jgi:hypothetical protein